MAAYNAGDVEAFVGHFSQDARIVRNHDTMTHQGPEAIRDYYRQPLADKSRVNVLKRITVGRHVVDLASVTKPDVGGSTQFLTMYLIDDGKIARVDFIGAEIAVWP